MVAFCYAPHTFGSDFSCNLRLDFHEDEAARFLIRRGLIELQNCVAGCA